MSGEGREAQKEVTFHLTWKQKGIIREMPENRTKYFNSPNQFVGCPNFGY